MKVLFVDDDMLVIQDILNNLNAPKLGIDKLFKAGSASEAKAVFAQTAIDLIVCDIEMHRVSGIDVLSWVQEY